MIELERMGTSEWDQIVDGEPNPFGGVGEELAWRAKERHFGIRDGDGRLLAAAGLVRADVRAGHGEPFAVAGLGGVIVTRSQRGRGLARALVERALLLAPELGVEHAMLFCLPHNVPLYERFGFHDVEGEIRAGQPGRTVTMPLGAMWRALRPGAEWPPGAVEVLGEPF